MNPDKIKEEIKEKIRWASHASRNNDEFLKLIDLAIDEVVEQSISQHNELLIKKIEEMEVYDDEPDNCRRIINEIKYLIKNSK